MANLETAGLQYEYLNVHNPLVGHRDLDTLFDLNRNFHFLLHRLCHDLFDFNHLQAQRKKSTKNGVALGHAGAGARFKGLRGQPLA